MNENGERLEVIVITTYADLKPYVEALVRLLEQVYEAGKSKGEEAAQLNDQVITLLRSASNEHCENN